MVFTKNSPMQQALLPTVWRSETPSLSFPLQLQLPHFYVCNQKISYNIKIKSKSNAIRIFQKIKIKFRATTPRQSPFSHLSSTKTQFDGSSFSWRTASRYISDSGFLNPANSQKNITKSIELRSFWKMLLQTSEIHVLYP